jgi:hypothetical protein
MTSKDKIDLAKRIYVVALSNAEDLGMVSEDYRKVLFTAAANICLEAAETFFEVAHNR